jgi:arylsulfatase A-like enzyme
VLGGLDAFCANEKALSIGVARIAIAGAAVGTALGVLVGLVLGTLGLLARQLAIMPGPLQCSRRPLSAARGCAVLAALALALAVFAYPLMASERIVILSLRRVVLALGAALSTATALLAMPWLEHRVVRTLSRFRAHAVLASSGTRFTVLVVTPTLAVCIPLLKIYGTHLGSLRRLLLAVGFLVLERAVFLFARSGRRERALRIASAQALMVFIGVGPLLLRPGSRESGSLTRAHAVPDAVSLLQRLTDVDRDGFSSLFGGKDCAALDRSRFPGARETIANGIDEDCDGADALKAPSQSQVEPKFSSQPRLSEQPFNVLWYIVDSLRPDHLKMYGYPFDTSPTLTALAADAWVFDEAYSQSSTTALSVPSMFSGRNPLSMRFSRGVFPNASGDETYLSRAFSARGYLSGLAINAWVKEFLPGIQHGFERVLVSPPEVNWRSGDYLLSNVFQLVSEARALNKSFFAVAHVDDVHHPYLSAEGKAVPQFASAGEKARYDAGIALFDQGLRVAVEHLRYAGLWDRTILIVTADHGEEFAEHGGSIHSRTCYEEVTHVPLLIRVPGAAAQRVRQRVALIDLAPTLLELLGARSEPGMLDGQSLFIPVYEPGVLDPERPIFCAIHQVMEGRQPLFIRAVRRGPWAFFQELKTGRAELYNRDRDAGEHVDLMGSPTHAAAASALGGVLSSIPEGNLFRVSEGLE